MLEKDSFISTPNSAMQKVKQLEFIYNFKFEDGEEAEFKVVLDAAMRYMLPQDDVAPEWARLEYNKCQHCPLSRAQTEFCPVAQNIAHITERFKDRVSYLEALVSVETENRTYVKQTSLQQGLFSIYGLIMATSDCPYMDFLKPMARFHLPFASVEETLIRSSSMFLLKQYLAFKDGRITDLNLTQLDAHYENINMVNQGILKRISGWGEGDSKSNAVVTLHTIAQYFKFEISGEFSSVRGIVNPNQ